MKKRDRKRVRNQPVSVRESALAPPEKTESELAHIVKPLIESAAPAAQSGKGTDITEMEVVHVDG